MYPVCSVTVEAAKRILELGYTEADHARMAVLSQKSNEGELTDEERHELGGYVSTGDMLAILKSKARQVLLSEGEI